MLLLVAVVDVPHLLTLSAQWKDDAEKRSQMLETARRTTSR